MQNYLTGRFKMLKFKRATFYGLGYAYRGPLNGHHTHQLFAGYGTPWPRLCLIQPIAGGPWCLLIGRGKAMRRVMGLSGNAQNIIGMYSAHMP